IGSKYYKIEMARGLMEIQSGAELENVMEENGWDEAVQEYEEGLDKVLPRIEKTLHEIKFVVPPEDGDFSSRVGFKRFLHPVEMLFGSESQQEQLVKELYAEGEGDLVRLFSAV
ncbi:MAG: hypothetical protein ABEJ65_06805, partial [bacterium]